MRCICPVRSDAIGPHTRGCPNHPEARDQRVPLPSWSSSGLCRSGRCYPADYVRARLLELLAERLGVPAGVRERAEAAVQR